MKVKLARDISIRNFCGRRHELCERESYAAGDVIEVTPASNLPGTGIVWITQDGWNDNAYGFPLYPGEYEPAQTIAR